MTQHELSETNATPEHTPVLGSEGTQALGYAATSESERGIDRPIIDVTVNGIDQATYSPAEASPYLGTAERGLNLVGEEALTPEITEYLGGIFPDSHFSFLGAGRYGIVLADETGKAFKLYRTALNYSMYEREAGALQLLSEAGLAPRVHLFVDAGQKYRLDEKHYDYTDKGFEDIQIPRQNSGKELPVLIMDKVDAKPLEEADPILLADGFCQTAEVFMRENINSMDSEAMIDKQTGRVIFLDAGDLSQAPFDRNETPDIKIQREAYVLRDVILLFGLTRVEGKIQSAYKQNGLEGLREFIVSFLRASS